MAKTKLPGRADGFTLIEVLIAVAIFAVAVSIVYSLYDSMVSVAQQVENRVELNDRVRVVQERLAADFEGLSRGSDGIFVGREADGAGDEPFLEFISTAHLSFRPDSTVGDLALIRYYLHEEEGDDGYSLLRSDSLLIPGTESGAVGEGRREILSTGLKSLTAVYRSRREQDESTWDAETISVDGEDTDSRFPAAVGVELVFSGESGKEQDDQHYTTLYWLRPAKIVFQE